MVSIKQINSQLSQQFYLFFQKINTFFTAIGTDIKNFKNLTLGEQIAYCAVAGGVLLVLSAIVIFMII